MEDLDYYNALIENVSTVFNVPFDEVTNALYKLKTFDSLFACILASKEIGMRLKDVAEKRINVPEIEAVCKQESSKWKTKLKDFN